MPPDTSARYLRLMGHPWRPAWPEVSFLEKGMSFRHAQTVSSKGSIVGVSHASLSFETRRTHQRRRRDQPAAARTIRIKVVGSGMAAFALAPEPEPAVWPKRAAPHVVVAGVNLVVAISVGGKTDAHLAQGLAPHE